MAGEGREKKNACTILLLFLPLSRTAITQPSPSSITPSLSPSIHSAIYARKQAEAEELRVQIMANARRAEEEACLRSGSNHNDNSYNYNNNDSDNDINNSGCRTIAPAPAAGALPQVLETGLEALREFDENGRRNPRSAAAASSSLVVGVRGGGGGGGGGHVDSSDEEDEMDEGEGGREGMSPGLEGRKRQRTMADVVQLHRDLSDLQRTRTELRWLLGQVERLEYESL